MDFPSIRTEDMIFVFGSNRAGRHGKGAAKYANIHRGAEYYVGEGLTGTSYALPTMDKMIQPLYLDQIRRHVDKFLEFASSRKDLNFQVTQVACGLGGRTPEDIAPLFYNAPDNCYFDTGWEHILGDDHKYWGTFP